jgi:hypothetical protein
MLLINFAFREEWLRGRSLLLLLLTLVLLLLIGGCDGAQPPPTSAPPAESSSDAAPSSDDQALAWVGGDAIRRAELDFALSRIDGAAAKARAQDDGDLEGRMLESLIQARALATLAERELAPSALARLELQVRAYREELLVQAYLADHASPEPLPTQQIEDYYRDNPESFGGGRELSFELVQAPVPRDDAERDRLITALAGLDAVADWADWVQTDESSRFEYRAAVARPELLERPLRDLLEATPAGAVSPIGSGERLLRARVIALREIPARPLAEVAPEIERRLAPLTLRETIREVAERAVGQLGVRYARESPAP